MSADVSPPSSLRILAVSETWQGSNAYAFVRAFRRAGHSVHVIADDAFAGTPWKSVPMRAARRLLWPLIIREAEGALVEQSKAFQPHLLFAFKGVMVTPAAVRSVQQQGGVAINFWPDVSVAAHGSLPPQVLPLYNWVFTTKSFGIADMARHGVSRASFLPHGFDPETHRPASPDALDPRLPCAASFIGTWSPKKEDILAALLQRHGKLDLRIWGAQWQRASTLPPHALQQREITGASYAAAISASRINIALLSEARAGASSGDLITSRTFHIPASGGFMLHERSDEIGDYFSEDREAVFFTGGDELADKIRFYLAHDDLRRRIAAAGHHRALRSGYSIDDRAAVVLAKARQLLAQQQRYATTAPRGAATLQAAPSEQARVGAPLASET